MKQLLQTDKEESAVGRLLSVIEKDAAEASGGGPLVVLEPARDRERRERSRLLDSAYHNILLSLLAAANSS